MNTAKVSIPTVCFKKFGKFQVRSILQSDVESVKKLILKVRRELNASARYLSDSELDHLFEAYQGEKSVFLVLTFNKRIIGTIGIQPLHNDGQIGCELKKFYLKKSWRGFGIGLELIDCCLTKAYEMKYRECYLETDPTLKSAGKIYQRLGFVPISESVVLPVTKYQWHKKNLIDQAPKENKNE